MTRHIQVDTTTSVGYSYVSKNYFVKRDDTKTTRLTAAEVKSIIDIVSPDNTTTVEQIEALSTTLETLNNAYYTLEDTGIGIKSIRFNDYTSFPLVINDSLIYIMNTNISYDLKLGFSESSIIADLRDFYETSLGLNITLSDMQILFNYLKNNTYSMHVYNEINSETTYPTLTYTNVMKTADYKGNSQASYTATFNPDSEYEYVTVLGSVESIVMTTRTITLTSTISQTLTAGDTVEVIDCGDNDGVYTVVSSTASESKQVIVVKENFQEDFSSTGGSLNLGTEVTKTLLNVTSSNNTDKLPETEFMVDSTAQLTSYLTLVDNSFGGSKIPLPTSTIYSLIKQSVPLTTTITGLSVTPILEGLYSKVYES